MKQKLFTSVFVGICLSAFTACQSDVDLKNIDTKAGAEMALALPIGEVSAELDDFLGYGNISDFIQVGDGGVFFYEDTFKVARKYTHIDLARYVAKTHQNFTINPTAAPITLEAGKEQKFSFDLPAKFDNINVGGVERIDSVWIRQAQLISNFFISGANLPFNAIKKVEIQLDDHFRRAAGTTITVVNNSAAYGYNQNIPVTVDDFTLSLLKDRTQPVGDQNVTNEVGFKFVFTVQPDQAVTIQPNAYIGCNFQASVQQFNAVWGMFILHNHMYDADTIVIADELSWWNDFVDSRLPLADPTVHVKVKHSISGPIKMDGDYLFVKSTQSGTQVNATFNGATSVVWDLPNVLSTTAPLDAVVENEYTFNKDEAYGNIDELFSIFPDLLGYSYHILPDVAKFQDPSFTGAHHYRVTENPYIDVDAIVHIPFIFGVGADGQGVNLSYADTTTSFEVSNIALDSLINVEGLDIKTADVKLVCQAKNTIPFNIEAELVLLDSLNQEVKLIVLNDDNKLHIAGPTKEKVKDGVVVEPEVSTFVISVDQDKLNQLADIKKVYYKAHLGHNTCEVRVLDKSNLSIRLAATAKVSAEMDLEQLF